MSNFPNSLDSFINYVNITAADGPLIRQYLEAMQQGNQVEASNIFTQIPAGTQKLITAQGLNKIVQATLALERFWNTDIFPQIENLQQSWENLINRLSYKDTWSSGTAYDQNNIVDYTVNGQQLLFIAILEPPTGTPPTNTTYWRQITMQGLQGPSGESWAYRGEWDAAQEYTDNDVVSYDGVLWHAKQTNVNRQPNQSPDYWELMLMPNIATYPIQETAPVNQVSGGLWFNTDPSPTQYYYLAPLSRPATAAQITAGYQAYGANGQVIVGTA